MSWKDMDPALCIALVALIHVRSARFAAGGDLPLVRKAVKARDRVWKCLAVGTCMAFVTKDPLVVPYP